MTDLNREELEDKFFRLKDQHLELKKEAHNAEHQMKYLNAKLSRLISEKKRLLNKEKTKREIDLEELIYDMHDRSAQLDRENGRLREKMLVLKTRLDTEIMSKRSTSAYSHVRSRTDSGLGQSLAPFRPLSTRASSALVLNRGANASESRKGISFRFDKSVATNVGTATYAYNLLQEAQEEIKRLEDVVAMQQSHIESQHQSNKMHALNNSLSSHTPKSITNNFDKTTNFSAAHSDHSPNKEQTLKKHNQLLSEHLNGKKISEDVSNLIEKLQKDLSIERGKCCEMKKKLLEESVTQKASAELEQRIEALLKENEILKKSLQQCIGSCLTEIGENTGNQTTEHELHMQLSNLQSELSRAQNDLQIEKFKYAKLVNEYQQLQTLYSAVRLKVQQLETKINCMGEANADNACNRSDHFDLTGQLQAMQTERQQLLTEFDEMKHLLQSVQNSLSSQQ